MTCQQQYASIPLMVSKTSMQQALLWSLYTLVMAADAPAMLISIGKYVHSYN